MLRSLVALLAGSLLACGGSSRGGGACAACGAPGCAPCPPPDTGRTWPTGRPAGYANPIPAENALAGDPGWRAGKRARAGQIEAYLDHVSARAGQTVGVAVNVDAAHGVTWALYRFGWYGGAEARRVAEGASAAVLPQPACPPAADGLVQCAWATAFRIPLPADLVSGYYAVRLVRDDGYFTLAPLVVVDDRPADLLAQASVDTWQAYNGWGGESLYQDASGAVPGGFAVRVSFDRPYATLDGLGSAVDLELALARFLERHGYDVSYTTNLDVAAGGAAHLTRAGAFLSVGHDEYWSGASRAAVDAARDAGVPILFFGANAAYWKVRYEGPGADGAPRIVTCHKAAVNPDPVAGPEATGRFRDPTIDRPESALVGVEYESWQLLEFPLVVSDPTSWLFDGTGLAAGDALPGLVGNEYDAAGGDAGTQPGLTVVARSPLLDAEGKPGWAATAWRRAPSGALVFAAGTIHWARGLDPHRDAADPRLGRMTANVLQEALGLPVPAALAAPAPPPGWPGGAGAEGPYAAAVSTVARGLVAPTGLAVLADGSLAVADARRHQVLTVDRAGAVTLLAGDPGGQPGRNGSFDGVPGASARFNAPTALLALPDGSLLVSDTGNACLRRIGADTAHTVTTFAGHLNQAGLVDGPAAQARFRFPMGLARDPGSGVIYVADSGNQRVRAIDLAGRVTTVAGAGEGDRDGPGATALLSFPTGVAVGPDGRVYVVASPYAEVKAIGTDPARTVVTLAGGAQGVADGGGATAGLAPQGGVVWAGGELLFSDPPSYRVRALAPGAGRATTTVHTVAGSRLVGAADGPGAAARLGPPAGLAVGPDGTVYVADPGNGAVRAIVR